MSTSREILLRMIQMIMKYEHLETVVSADGSNPVMYSSYATAE